MGLVVCLMDLRLLRREFNVIVNKGNESNVGISSPESINKTSAIRHSQLSANRRKSNVTTTLSRQSSSINVRSSLPLHYLLSMGRIILQPRVYVNPRQISNHYPENEDESTRLHRLQSICIPPISQTDFVANGYHNSKESMEAGFLYYKPKKCASTTAVSIQMRIARNYYQQLYGDRHDKADISRTNHSSSVSTPLCDMSWMHGSAQRFRHRDRLRSLLWTLLREPTQRYISNFFFRDVSHQHRAPSDANFVQHKTFAGPITYYEGMSTRPLPSSLQPPALVYAKGVPQHLATTVQQVGQEIIDDYDFIGIVERFEESMVVFSMLFDLSLADILYLKSKVSGTRSLDTGVCLVQPFVSDSMKAYFDSDEWQDYIQYDFALYNAANVSLDLTIKALGREKVEAQLERYRRAQALVQERCGRHGPIGWDASCNPNTTAVPHAKIERQASWNRTGRTDDEYQESCIYQDKGCGMTCLDKIATEMNLGVEI